MLIASAQLDAGGQLLVLGLSAENRKRLEAGKPLDISRESHGLAVPAGLHIVIFAGDTEASMQRAMAGLIGPDTVLNQRKPQ